MSTRTRTLAIVLAAVVAGLLARGIFAEASGLGPADLIRYEDRSYGVDLPDHYGETPFWLTWSRGDGQAYVTLAGDPWAQDEVRNLGVALYRYARVGYAWAALLAVGGQSDLIPYGLFAVNVVSLAILGWVAASRFEQWGPRSLLLVCVPGALIATTTDTAEALGIALATVAVTSAAPTALVLAAALGIVRPDFATVLFLRGRRGIGLIAACAVGAIAVRLLGMGLGLEYSGLNRNLTLPLAGYFEVLGTQTALDTTVTVILLAAAILTLHRGLRQETGWMRLAPLATGLFVLMLSPAVLGEAVNSLRAAAALSLIWAIPANVMSQGDRPAAR